MHLRSTHVWTDSKKYRQMDACTCGWVRGLGRHMGERRNGYMNGWETGAEGRMKGGHLEQAQRCHQLP